MPKLDLTNTSEVTRTLSQEAARGKTWRVRLEYIGINPVNKSRRSMKFWEAEGLGQSDVVTWWGKIGTVGQTKGTFFAGAMMKLAQKVVKKMKRM